jgi:hypothetical protein
LEYLTQNGESPKLFRYLLPFGFSAVVDLYLSGLTGGPGAGDWVRLARYHPETTSNALRDWAAPSGDEYGRLLQAVNLIINQLVARQMTIDTSLELVKILSKETHYHDY